MFTEITEDNLNQIVEDNGTVLVQFSAGWCGNCRIMKPKFKKLSQEHEEMPFVMVDAEKYPESRKLANVDNLPTFAAFKDGKLLKQFITDNDADYIHETIETLENLTEEDVLKDEELDVV
ncbi:unnamed protein product, partial [Cyprideis torosa]